MTRWWRYRTALVVAAVLLAALVVAPVLAWSTGGGGDGDDAPPETTTITSYRALFDLTDYGTLYVTETLDVSFPDSSKHGIFRFWDRVDPAAPGLRREPSGITVTRDGVEEPLDVLSEQRGRLTVARIGSEDVYVEKGIHQYGIRYIVDDAIGPGADAGTSRFLWDLVPGGWRQDIEEAELRVALPAASTGDVDCSVGGQEGGCTVEGVGTDTLVVRASDLAAYQPVTLSAGLAQPTPPTDTLAWAPRWDRVLGTSEQGLVTVLILAVLAGLVGLGLAWRSREKPPEPALRLVPPDGLGPAQGAYLLTERIGRTQHIATLMHAADRGAISLTRSGSAWSAIDQEDPERWASLDPLSRRVKRLLDGSPGTFTAASWNPKAGKKFGTEMTKLDAAVQAWSRKAGLMTRSRAAAVGCVLVLIALPLVLLLTLANPFAMTTTALVPGLFALAGSSLLLPGARTRRTPAGREVWAELEGFRRTLSASADDRRLGLADRPELYGAYLPWAVALGIAPQWARTYELETHQPVPQVTWLPLAGTAHPSGDVGSMVDSFDSALSAAVSAHNATQAGSSSGGGGYSGGGGGGGGGGGSW